VCNTLLYNGAIMKKTRLRKTEKERRNEFKDAALDLFDSKGFDNVTTKDIAEKAGLSRSLIYRYGSSKTEILEEWLRDTIRKHARALEELPSPTGSPTDRVMAYLVKMFEGDVAQYELRRLAVQHSWTWSAKSEEEFFFLVGDILNPISKSLSEVKIEWNLGDRVAIWAIYTEGLRQVMNRHTKQLGKPSQKAIAAMAGAFDQRVRPQISRLLSHN
jgi:AcrR family transcriptional regulator